MMGFLRREFVWMVLSLLLATALWTIVTNQQNPPETDYLQSIPVKVRGEPTGLVVRDAIRPVRVRITAPRDVWQRLSSASFDAYVDASKVGPGVQDLPVHVETSDSRVRIDEIQPSKVTLRLEDLVRKDVPVSVNVVGSVPLGYTSKPPRFSPEQVTISGPQSQVNSAALAVVEVRLDALRATLNQPFKPVIQDAEGEEVVGVAAQPESVFVEVPVDREISYKTVPVAPRLTGAVGLGYQIVGIVVDPTAVTVVGDPNALADLSYLPTKPVDVTDIKGDSSSTVEAALPEGVALARKQNIVVRVYASAVEGSQSFRVAPALKGGEGKPLASITPSAVNVVLSGPVPILTAAKAQDIKVVGDISDLGQGTHTVNTIITVPAGLRLDSISPEQLTVVIP